MILFHKFSTTNNIENYLFKMWNLNNAIEKQGFGKKKFKKHPQHAQSFP